MRLPVLLLAPPVLLLAVLAACGGGQDAHPPGAHAPDPGAEPASTTASGTSGPVKLTGSGQFAATGTSAVTYDPELVPVGATASLTAESTAGRTLTSLVVEGFLPNRGYGAHLHTRPCGRTGDDAGPHYQHQPGRASAANEVWLDLTTDAAGSGRATARHPWHFAQDRPPGSLVIHATLTKSTGPEAGAAGARLACLTLR